MKVAKNMEFDRKIVGEVIRRQRQNKGLSQEIMSGFAVIARSHWSEIESGKHALWLETFWKIATALELRPSELMRLIEEETERRKQEENEQKQE